MALASADTYVVVVALPDMMTGVGMGIDQLHSATPIISGFLLGCIAVLPLIGRLSDLVARQDVLLFCLSLFVVGSAITAVSIELPVLVAGRVLQGMGGGGLVPATLALVADLWPPERRGTPLGVVGAVQELGSVLGPLLGAAVLAVADWRAIFWLNVACGIVLAAALGLTGGRGERLRLRVLPTVLGLTTVVYLAALAVARCQQRHPRYSVRSLCRDQPPRDASGRDHPRAVSGVPCGQRPVAACAVPTGGPCSEHSV